MASVSDLLLLLRADTTDVDEKLKQTTRELNATARKFESIGSTLTSAGTKLTAGITLPILAAGGAMAKVALDFDDATDNIRIGTGATGKALEGLSQSMREVFRTVPTDIGSASTAISDLNTRLGLSGPPLESLAAQMLNLSRLTKNDLQPLIAATTRVFGDWSIATDKQGATLDYLFRVSQSTGIGVDKLSEQVVQFGAPLRQMGFNLETSAALLGKFEKEGVNAELVMGSLRIALTRLSKAGIDDAAQGLQILSNEIKNAGSTGEANRKAIELFGAKAGPDMAAAIREGRFEIGELVKQLENSPETIERATKATDGFAEKLVLLKNRAALAAEPLGVKLIESLDRIIERSGPVLKTVESLVDKFAALPPSVQDAAVAMAGIAAAAGPVLIFFGAVAGGIGNIIKLTKDLLPHLVKLGPAFRTIAGALTSVAGASVAVGAGIAYVLNKFIELDHSTDHSAERAKKMSEQFDRLNGVTRNIIANDDISRINNWATAVAGATPKKDAITTINDWANTVAGAGKAASGASEDNKKLPPTLDNIDLSAKKAKDGVLTFAEAVKSIKLSEHNQHIQDLARFYLGILDPLQQAQRRQEQWNTTLQNSPGAIVALKAEIDSLVAATGPAIDAGKLFEQAWQLPTLPPPALGNLYDDVRKLGVVLDQDLKGSASEAQRVFTEMGKAGVFTAEDMARAEIKVLEARKAAGQATEEDIRKLEALKRIMGGVEQTGVQAAKKQEGAWNALGRQVSTIITDMSRGIADVLVKGGEIGSVFKNVSEQIVTALARTAIEQGVNVLLKSLDGLLGKLGGVRGAIGKVFGGGFGGVTTPPFAGGGIPGLGGTDAGVKATGAAGSPLPGGASSTVLSSGLSATLGAVFGGITAVSSVIGNFQAARQEGTLNAIEQNTRYTMIGQLGPRGLLDMTFEIMANLQTINSRFDGWIHDAWVEILGTTAEIRDLMARTVGGPAKATAGAPITFTGDIVVEGTSDPRRTAEEVAKVMKRRSSRFN